MSWIATLCLGAAVVYVLRGAFFLLGAWRAMWRSRKRLQAAVHDFPKVSVVIPARNEERTIARCVESVFACDYPDFEVVVVDDMSTDGTAEVLRQLQSRYGARLRVVHRREEPHQENLRGKAGALHMGMEQVRGEIALFTDADCTVAPGWIRAMARFFADPAVGFVAGFTLVGGQRFFERFQAAEWLLLHAAESAGIGWNLPLGCFGNNLGVRVRAYWDTGGYERIPFSVTEDLALQQAIHRRGWRMEYAYTPEALVTTLPVATVGEYWRQHRRWGRGGVGLGVWAGAFLVTTLLFWVPLIGAAVTGYWAGVLLLAGVRGVCDALLGLSAVRRLRLGFLAGMLFFAIPFLALVELLLPFVVLLQPRIRWKGRVFG